MLTLIFVAMFLIGSCKKDESDFHDIKSESSVKIDFELLNEIRELPSMSAKRIAFSKLSAAEKLAILNLQFDYVLKEIPINDEQRNLINEMKTHFKPDMYSDDYEISSKFMQTTVNEYREKNLLIFGKDFVRKYFSNINNPNLSEAERIEAPKSCACSWEADWCSWGYDCIPDSTSSCAHTVRGCGDLLLFDGDGNCVKRSE